MLRTVLRGHACAHPNTTRLAVWCGVSPESKSHLVKANGEKLREGRRQGGSGIANLSSRQNPRAATLRPTSRKETPSTGHGDDNDIFLVYTYQNPAHRSMLLQRLATETGEVLALWLSLQYTPSAHAPVILPVVVFTSRQHCLVSRWNRGRSWRYCSVAPSVITIRPYEAEGSQVRLAAPTLEGEASC